MSGNARSFFGAVIVIVVLYIGYRTLSDSRGRDDKHYFNTTKIGSFYAADNQEGYVPFGDELESAPRVVLTDHAELGTPGPADYTKITDVTKDGFRWRHHGSNNGSVTWTAICRVRVGR